MPLGSATQVFQSGLAVQRMFLRLVTNGVEKEDFQGIPLENRRFSNAFGPRMRSQTFGEFTDFSQLSG
jgi:hypothetical protein